MKVSCPTEGTNWQGVMLPVGWVFWNPLDTGSDSLGAGERRTRRSGEAAFGNECQGKTRQGKHSKGYGFLEHREAKAVKVSEELCLCEKTGPSIFRIKLQMKKLGNRRPALKHCLSHYWAHRVCPRIPVLWHQVYLSSPSSPQGLGFSGL